MNRPESHSVSLREAEARAVRAIRGELGTTARFVLIYADPVTGRLHDVSNFPQPDVPGVCLRVAENHLRGSARETHRYDMGEPADGKPAAH